jgi:hypothetical protein
MLLGAPDSGKCELKVLVHPSPGMLEAERSGKLNKSMLISCPFHDIEKVRVYGLGVGVQTPSGAPLT